MHLKTEKLKVVDIVDIWVVMIYQVFSNIFTGCPSRDYIDH